MSCLRKHIKYLGRKYQIEYYAIHDKNRKNKVLKPKPIEPSLWYKQRQINVI